MKVISTNPDGSALVEFENLVVHTNVIGVTAPIRVVVAISEIPEPTRIGQKGRREAQRFKSMFAHHGNNAIAS